MVSRSTMNRPAWVANVVGNGGVDPYPDGLDTKALATADGKHVAVVWVPSTPTPPCNAHGTVYERGVGLVRISVTRTSSGSHSSSRRGDQARKDAHAKADAAAREMLIAGRDLRRYMPTNIQFGLGLAAAGYLDNISARLFSESFEAQAFGLIQALGVARCLVVRGLSPPWRRTLAEFESEGGPESARPVVDRPRDVGRGHRHLLDPRHYHRTDRERR